MNIIELTQALLELQSVSYHEKNIAEYISHFFEQEGIQPILDHFNPSTYLNDGRIYPDTSNVYVKIGNGDHTLMLYAHTDVVEGSDTQFISHIKWNEIYQDDCLYGRGSSDMKSSLAGLMIAAVKTKQLIESSEKQVLFAFIADEEMSGTGAQHHVNWLNANGYNEDNLWAVLTEPTDDFSSIHIGGKGYIFIDVVGPLQSVVCACKDILRKRSSWLAKYKVTEGFSPPLITLTTISTDVSHVDDKQVVFSGKRGHASRPSEGDNALEKLLTQIEKPLSYIATGGNSPNQIPDICSANVSNQYANIMATATIDIRTTPTADHCDSLYNSILYHLSEYGLNVSVRDRGLAYYHASVKSELYPVCAKSSKASTSPEIAQGGSDAGYYKSITPYVIGGFGPGFLRECHQSDEKIPLKSLRQSVDVFSQLILNYLQEG